MIYRSIILCAALCSSMQFAYATSSTQTHLHYHRFHELRTGPLSTVTHTHNKHAAPFLDGSIRATILYDTVLKNSSAGKLLGATHKKSVHTFAHINTAASVAAEQADVTNNLFIHAAPDGSGNSLTVKLNAQPSYYLYGIQLDYEQYIPFFSGCYLGLQMPLLDCRTNLFLTASDASVEQSSELLDYFAGIYSSDAAQRAQEKLRYNRFDTSQKKKSWATQINARLRKTILNTSRIHCDVAAHMTLPMTKPAGSTFLFEPTLGSNGHWQIGASIDGSITLWNRFNNTCSLSARTFAGYTLAASQERTIGLNQALTVAPFGHYALLTYSGAPANASLIPAANVLTQNLSITPGWHSETTGTLAWAGKNVRLEVGYTFEHRSAESTDSFAWKSGTYALAGAAYDTSASFAAQTETDDALVMLTTAYDAPHTYLERTDLDSSTALMPEYNAHHIWFSTAYQTTLGSLPFYVRAGTAVIAQGSAWQKHAFSVWASAQLSF